jgi:hypothetical protein
MLVAAVRKNVHTIIEIEIPVTVRFQNLYSKGYYIPLEYIKKTGPSIKLTDRGNKEHATQAKSS